MTTKFGELPPSSSTNTRIYVFLRDGYNPWVIRPLSSYQSRTALKKKIEARLRMANYGVSPHAVKAGKREEAHQALLAAYRLILDEEGAEYAAKRAEREPHEGGVVARVSGGRVAHPSRRFYDVKRAYAWAEEFLKGKPGMRVEFFHHESMGSGLYSKQPFAALEANGYGHVLRASVYPLPPLDSNKAGQTGPYEVRERGTPGGRGMESDEYAWQVAERLVRLHGFSPDKAQAAVNEWSQLVHTSWFAGRTATVVAKSVARFERGDDNRSGELSSTGGGDHEPPSELNVLDRHGGFTAITKSGTLWRPGRVLKRGTVGKLISFDGRSFYQLNHDVTKAIYKVPGYGYKVVAWFDNKTGARIA